MIIDLDQSNTLNLAEDKMSNFGEFGKQRFPEQYQNRVGINAREILHKNSLELVRLLKEKNILKDNIKVFEMGAGGGRNLFYIWNENNSVSLACNDLFRDASLNNMHPLIKDKLDFIEGDSEDVTKNHFREVDLFLVSDHFMHLQYEKAENIITNILERWKPTFITLREVKKDFESPKHPKLYHNYSRFLEKYELIHESTSENDSTYFIWILRKK
jgi:hypothetical protein